MEERGDGGTARLWRVLVPDLGQIVCNVQPGALVISDERRNNSTFDADGRLLGAFRDGVNYRRSLEHTILAKHIVGTGAARTKMRRWLGPDERAHLIADLRGRVQQIRAHLDPAVAPELCGRLDAVLAWDAARLEAERAIFQATYRGPVSVLPPDQYLAVVLQATEGCSWNQCSFCSLYRDRRFRIKPPAEFRQHAQQVRALLGQSLRLRKSIFLADANALIAPQPRLRELLAIVHEEFPASLLQSGIYAFLDIFGAERKTLEQYRELRALGVRRVYIGLETGDAELFRLLNKPGSPHECVEAVRTMRAAGIAVGIILLAGAGGDRLAAQHIAGSLETIAAMGLDAGDMVYLSPLVVSGADAYAQRMRELGICALGEAEVQEQVAAFKAALRRPDSSGPRVSVYHIEEFIY